MQKAVYHEAATMVILVCVAALVFVETSGFATAPGQISPAFFPRLGAGAMVALATIRLGSLWLTQYRPQLEFDWSWAATRRPATAVFLMLGYYAAFGILPFPLLTFGFLAAAFWTFGVTPWHRNLISAAFAAGLFYVVFDRVFRLPL